MNMKLISNLPPYLFSGITHFSVLIAWIFLIWELIHYINGQWYTKTLSSATCSQSRNLSVSITLISPNTITWHLGTYSQNQGKYAALILEANINALAQNTFIPLAPQGQYTFEQPLSKPLKIIVKYIDSAGWETYSEPLVLNPNQRDEQGMVKVTWQQQG